MRFRLSLPKLVRYVLIAFLFTLNVLLRKNGPPKLLSKNGNCDPKNNIAFLKTHTCASSSIQNILFRYGFTQKLHFALPSVGNYFGDSIIPFNAEMISKTPWHRLGRNIFALHTKWDHQQVVSVMPNDTIFITIVREPTELFESLFVFTKMEQHLDKNLESYIQDVSVDSPRWHNYLGFNQMTWDFGMPGEYINNITAVKLMVEKASNEFDLVMVAERMDESLVLLSDLLCWSLEEVLVLKINARVKEHKKSISEESKKILRDKQKPDQFLYEFFNTKFDNLVEAFGRQRMAQEVSKLQNLQEELLKNCNVLKDKQENIKGANKPWSNMVDGYQSSSNDTKCSMYTIAELQFLDLIRGRQRQEVMQSGITHPRHKENQRRRRLEIKELPEGGVPEGEKYLSRNMVARIDGASPLNMSTSHPQPLGVNEERNSNIQEVYGKSKTDANVRDNRNENTYLPLYLIAHFYPFMA